MPRYVLPVVLAILVCAGCTKPPYASPDKGMAEIEADFTDCYSLASLKANTPPYPASQLAAVDRDADACMIARNYVRSWWRLY